MYKSRNITDFFKPFAHPRPLKRPRLDDDTQDTITVEQPNSSSLKQRHNDRDGSHRDNSSEKCLPTSSLTSLDSEDESLASINVSEPMGGNDMPGKPKIMEHLKEDLELQRSLLTSSQRVTKNGEVMIKNSDDESDSVSSLEDIDDLLVACISPPRLSPPTDPDLPCVPPAKQSIHDEGKKSSHWTTERRKKTTVRPSAALPVMPKYKFSLDSLVAQAQQYDAAEASAAQAQSIVESFDQEAGTSNERPGQGAGGEVNIDAGFVASVMKGRREKEDIERLMNAIKRTEALHWDKSWSFFDTAQVANAYKQPEFPTLEKSRALQMRLKSSLDRHEAFLGGYVGEVTAKGKLPEEILSWVIDATCIERKQDLREAYVSVLMDAGEQITSLMTPNRITMLFQMLGAQPDALNVEQPVMPSVQEVHENGEAGPDWSRLLSVLHIIAGTADCLTSDARTHAICMLCRLSIDRQVVNSSDIVGVMAVAFANLLESIPEHGFEDQFLAVLTTVYSYLTDSRLRLQLLKYIPPASLRLNLLRRRLALAYFFEDSAYLQKGVQDLTDFLAIAKCLCKTKFNISNGTDYTELAASIAILDIALDNGDSSASTFDKKDEDDFNKQVDKLTKTVKNMFTRIMDTGASHMTRTEAKDVLEALHARLIYTVRTKQKPKKTWFGGPTLEAGLDMGTGAYMKKFIAKTNGILELEAA